MIASFEMKFKKTYGRGSMYIKVINLVNKNKYKQAFFELIKNSKGQSEDVQYLELLLEIQLKLNLKTEALKTIMVLQSKHFVQDREFLKLELLMNLNRYNEALDISFRLSELNLNPLQVYKNFETKLHLYIYFNDFEGLEEELNTYSNLFKDTDVFSFAQGALYSYQENNNLALNSFRRAIDLNNTFDKAWVSLAIMHYKMGDRELALANIQQALDVNPQNSVAIKCFATWSEDKSLLDKALKLVSGYVNINNFEFELSQIEIYLLDKLGYVETAQAARLKSYYFFGDSLEL